HLPMMLSPKGEKLSKRHGSVSVHEYRDRGYSPMGVLNYLVRFGWSHGDQEIFSRDELVRAFTWDHVNKSDGKFDEKKFADVAFEHLKRTDLTNADEYATRTLPFLKARGFESATAERVRPLLPLIRERARNFADAAQHLDYFFRSPPALDPAAQKKFLLPATAPLLRELGVAFRALSNWCSAELEQCVLNLCGARGLTMKDVAQPLRVAATGRSASPPMFEVLELLGREATLERLEIAARIAETTP
ncbi:MAG TPA: glutamate--tRNA ligase family protein, partial [Polyangiaceae bacterium]